MNYSRVAVTGASGFVGTHLVVRLLDQNLEKIVCLVRNENSADKLRMSLTQKGVSHSKISFLTITVCELTDIELLSEAILGVDVVFHTAAKVSFSTDDRESLVNDNVLITECVVEAAKECGVTHFVHLSSIAALGDNDEGVAVDENSVPKSILTKSPYSISKFLSENVVWRYSLKGMNVTSLLPAVIIGRGDKKLGGTPQLTNLLSKGSLFYTDGVTGYVMIEDVVTAMIEVAGRKECFGERYVLCSENLSFREIILRLSGSKPKIKIGNNFIKFVKKIVKLLSFLKIELLIGESLLNNLVEKHFYNGNLISNKLGFKYRYINNQNR